VQQSFCLLQQLIEEESYARMNQRMWTDKEAQLVDIWV